MSKLGVTSPVFVTAIVAFSGLCVCACSAAGSALPPDAHVEILQTDNLVLHGTAAPRAESLSCPSSTRDASTHYLQLKENMTANIVLRPTGGVALLHVDELASNRTWCVMTRADGTGASIPGDFSSGVYAITVETSHTDAPTPYAVAIEKL